MFDKHYCGSLPNNLIWLRGVREVSPEEGKYKLRLEGHMKGILTTVGEGVEKKMLQAKGTIKSQRQDKAWASLKN